MKFLKASGKQDIHHSLYQTSSPSSSLTMYPSLVVVNLVHVGSGGVPDRSEGGDFVGVDLLDDVGEG